MFGLQESEEREVPDGLFLERLEAFMEKSLADIRAFSRRENRPFEETRRYVAEWHSKYLFKREPAILTGMNDEPSQGLVRSILCETSRVLESLGEVSGTQSFLLAVDPGDPADQGFLGGTMLGRAFWRGLRSGGDIGAKNFKVRCVKEMGAAKDTTTTRQSVSAAVWKPGLTSLKTEIYANVRSALRTASGVRNAEMKWTNHDRLGVYGVRIVGWPQSIPLQNPSTLTTSQNRVLLECLKNGTLHFVRKTDDNPAGSLSTPSDQLEVDLSWVYEDIGPS